MAEEAKWQRFSQRAEWFLDKITGNQWAQQTQQTQQQTSGQQSTGGIFLPWISNNQNLINSNKVSMNNWFTQWIQDWTIKSNIVLPWITNKPNEATLDTTTMKQKRQSYIYAKNNNINTKSINEQIEEERTWSNKVLGQTWKILKTYREAPINNFKKRWMRAIADSWLPWYFVDKTLEKAWAPDGLGDSIKDAVNETARKVALTYQNKVNEDFQKKVDKNIDARIREKYDNESITDLIWKWDGAWARYKIWKWTVENWNMIPEIWLMFVNPYVWLTAMWTDVYIQENQGTFEDMLQNWATYEQARNGAVAVWILNAWIELFMERFLWWAKWAWATALRRLFLKNAQREVVKQATKKWMAEIFARWVWERLKGSMVEWFEEVLQQITGNIMVKLINPDRDILDWARESFEWWFYNLFNWIWWATNIANEFKQNEQIQRNADIEALKYVAEWEQRKAQRMAREKARARFLERVKNPTMDNGYTPTPEQAQQRATEKEENEQFEDELRAEQNRETQIENDMLNEVLDEWDINEDLWDPRYQKNGDTVRSSDQQEAGGLRIDSSSTTPKVTITKENSSDYTTKLDEIKKDLEWLKADTFLERIKNSISWDQKTNYIINRNTNRKYVLRISSHHANAYNARWNKAWTTSIVIKLMDNPKFKKDNKVNLVEFVYNPENMTPATMQWIIEWIQNWIQTGQYTDMNFDAKNESTRKKWDKKYQLKYEEEWYTPWVARKDEKNISWKSGKMLKDFLKWQTIEELAKKYWVERIDVVKWLVDGMAYGSYSNRILRLAEEIKESTAPHELLHLVFDMVDPETKTYLISQVMQSEWWSAEKAEEWLADSFSNFYRTGKIESAPKSTWGKIKIFFKRVRSFINGMWKWRNQLEQMFTDIIESSGIEELQGKIDSNKEINESKAKMRKRFLEYRKNAEKTQEKTKKSKVKYQKADIDPEATSPEDLIEVNDKWLDVMVKFVSEKQKKNATDVNKELLTTDGKPYMWTSTNKYKSKVITDWRNVEDSKYKEYTDKWIQVARFTNNSSMSYSYADYKSKLAPVKKFKSIDELNKFFKENPNNYERILWNWIDDGVLKSSVVYEMKENDGKFELISNSTETLTQSMKDFYDGINNDWFWGNIWEMPENKDEALKKLQEYYNEHDYEIDWERTVKLLKNWNVERTVVKEPTVYKRFDTKLDALAEWYTIAQEADLYHYQWVIQKMKNPLVVDIRSKDNTPSTWSRLWTVNDIFDKEWINYNKEVDYYIRDVEEAMDGFSERMKALEQYWNDAYRDDPYGEVSQFMWNVQLSANNWVTYMVDELEDLLNDSAMWEDLKIGLDTEVYGDLRDYGRTLRDVITELRNFINTDRNYYALKKLSPEWIESWVKDMGAPKEVVKMIKNKNWKDMLGNWRDIGDKWWRENIKELLTTNWMDLETNDWVKYALDSGKYDWVIFKNIIDYGWLPKEWWENAKGGDVAVTFRSNQFKTWDNEDPTDSKYIRYQKMDDEYAEAVENWNTTRAKAILREYAKEKWYNSSTDYQWSLAFNGSAPSSDGLTKEERVSGNEDIYSQTLWDFASDGLDWWDLERQLDPNWWLWVARARASRKLSGAEYDLESINNLRNAVMEYKKWNKDVKIRMYRAIDSDIKEEKFRNWDWITPSKEYAKHHIDLQDWKKGRVISEDVSIEDIRWDGNDINERWFDNEKEYGYKDTPNNRKELEITYDDNGNLIPLIERFNENVEDERYQKTEYEYDENGKPKWIKFWEDNEFDPSIFWENTKEEQIEEDKENEKENPFYDAWMKYNNQNYKDDQITLAEFMDAIGKWGEKQQDEYDQRMRDIAEAENDPKMLELQLKAVKLMEKEQNVGKKFWKNVSKEVRDRQQAEVEKEREELVKEIFDWMYPWLKFEDATYDDMKMADEKEAEWEMLGKWNIEEKLKFFKKDKNWNREAKDIKIENPQIKLDKILSAGKFEEIFTPLDRVIEWRTPQWQHGVIDNQKNPKQYKSVMEKINAGKTKTKVTLKDVTRDYRALEKYKADQEAEKARKKKERDEAYAKKKQEEYKKIVRMKAFQRLVDMQRFEKYPFLTEEEIKNRYGFTDEEWKKITEQEEIKLPKKRWEKAISDLNKAVDSQVKALIEWLSWQNNLKRKDAEKNLWEIWEIDVDILLGRDEEKWQREVEEFEKIAEEEKKKSKKEKNKRMKEAVEEVLNIDIDTKREQQEKEKIEKMLKKVKNDETWKSKLWRELKTAFSTVDHKIKNISKPIYQALMQYFQNTSILTNERLKEATPFINALKKIRKENPVRYMDIRVALANRNIGYANGLLQEYGVKVPTKLLDTIYDEAEDVGLNINYLWSYYPLKVRSPKSLLTEIMWMKEWDFASEIDKRIKEESEKNWWPLDESQISDIIAEVIAWEDKWPDVRLWNAHMKKRNEKIKRTPKMLEYCYDPATTLIGYIEWMTQSIERAKFLGKSASWQVRDLSTYVYKVKHDLTWEQQDELMYLLQAVFNDKQQWFLFNTWRDIATLTTLWSPTSTLTQIWDLWFSIYENWLGNTWKALWNMWIKKWLFSLEDMWIVNRWEEFTNINEKKTRFQKWINLVFKITWFSKMDMFGKGMYIKSTRLKRQKRAKKWENWDPQLRKDIMKRTDDEYVTDKIISDIRHWIFSKEVSMIMFMKLSNFQPLTRAQMPEAYLNHPWYIRMLYQFKTFGLKQTNYIISECKEALKEAKNWTPQQKREAVWRIVSLVASLALMWLWADELKDLLMRRRNESMILRAIFWDGNIDDKFVDKFVDNLAKLSWLSRYAIMNIKNDPVGIITSLFTDMPWENVINYPYRDIKNWLNGKSSDQMTQLFPVVWKRYYWAIWWWHDKQMEKLDKENNKSTKKKSSWSTRKPLTR